MYVWHQIHVQKLNVGLVLWWALRHFIFSYNSDLYLGGVRLQNLSRWQTYLKKLSQSIQRNFSNRWRRLCSCGFSCPSADDQTLNYLIHSSTGNYALALWCQCHAVEWLLICLPWRPLQTLWLSLKNKLVTADFLVAWWFDLYCRTAGKPNEIDRTER